MGGHQAKVAALVALGVCGAAGATPAAADPLFEPPRLGKVRHGGGEHDDTLSGFFAEARALGVLGGRRLSAWPDGQLGIEPGEPQLIALRAGVMLWLTHTPVGVVLQLDLAAPTRPARNGVQPWEEPAGAFAGALVDDLYFMWLPTQGAQLVVGRARVPFSKLRQFDERDLPLGGVPFVIDRVAPDRRWGVMVVGDLGALSYAAGAWEDVDALELRAVQGDPSRAGLVLAGGHIEWTPVAPMMGAGGPGKVVGARGPLPTPRADPWFATSRLSAGLGLWARLDDAGGMRSDVTLSLQWKYRWIAALGEGLLAVNADGTIEQGALAEAHVTPMDKLSLSLRAEWDGGAGTAGAWSAGGGAMWHATRDRRSRIGLVGWFRQDRATGVEEDAVVVLIQTAL